MGIHSDMIAEFYVCTMHSNRGRRSAGAGSRSRKSNAGFLRDFPFPQKNLAQKMV